MAESARYLSKAAECEAMAELNPYPDERAAFSDLARLYRQLATHIERRERNATPPSGRDDGFGASA